MSPEQARGERVDHRADLFALGVIVYEMLAGRPPFQGSGVEIMMLNMHQDPPTIATRTGRQPDPLLEAFSRKLMARDPNERFVSASAALAVLDLIETNRDAAAEALGLASSVPEEIEEAAITKRHVRPASVPPPPSPPRHRRWGTAIGAAAFGIAALIAFVALRARGGEAPAIEVAPSPNELPLEVEGTAMLPPLPVE